MGIDGLLNLLKPVVQRDHISSFKNKTLAVDALPWLYKGCYTYTFELNQNIESNEYMYYIFQMIDLLKFYDIKPILVFDGRSLTFKSDTLQKRKRVKQQNKQKGFKSLQKDQIIQARKYFSRCIEITDRILETTMNCLRTKGIQFIVAPFQADSQIAKLKKIGVVQGAISEDSDLLLYGVNVIYKLNINGQCDYIDLQSVNKQEFKHNKYLYDFLNYSSQKRIQICIMTGCDYLPNIKGIGIKKSIDYMNKFKSIDKIVDHLKEDKTFKTKVPENYAHNIQKVKFIFLFAKTYDTLVKKLDYLSNLDNYNKEGFTNQDIEKIVGENYQYDENIQKGIVNCKTLEKRIIKTINFKQLYVVNKNNLIIHQVRNKIRKDTKVEESFTPQQIQEAKQLERIQKQKMEKEKKQQEQIKQKKKESINNFLNSLMKFADEEDSQQSKGSKSQIQIQQNENSDSQPFYKLNPFFKN